MRHIVLISCVSQKGKVPAKSQDLYLSDLFRKSLRYARSLSPDVIYVLSAKHGLVPLDQVIEPYDDTLNGKIAAEVRQWAARVVEQIGQVASLTRDHFTVLAGERYRRFLLPYLVNHDVPMKGLRIGQQLRFLKERIA